ncbi:MAG: hypothetical protein EXQ52_15985 [Bryobacterales bacterium]|nr:hypothetical protein [Bryobacterales bacterium]
MKPSWLKEGCQRYPAARELFILADGGGSNGPRCRVWRKAIQDTICTPLRITVTVSHYPPGASKWNPIEHRLFSQISNNWSGEPSPTSTRSSTSSVLPKPNLDSPSVPISSPRATRQGSRSQTRKCDSSTSCTTMCSAVGTIPYAPLRM